jgi:phasin
MMDQKIKMQVPAQVREFAEISVDQAEKAISSFMESASKSVAMVPGPMTDVAKQTLAITEANLKASFEHARNLMKAKDIDEVMKLQSEFMRKQFGTATEQFQRMTGGTASAANDALSENSVEKQ